MLALVACSALLGLVEPESPEPETCRAYQEARAHAGRSPEEQVKLALWCEAHGLSAERLNHLALAVLADPANAAARGLMGLVSRDGRWRRPEAVAARAQADPALAEYDAKRLRAPYTADGQWSLGVWADEHGLKDQAKAHLTAVTRLDPSREHAWKRLGFKKHDGRWVTEAQLAAEHADAEAQKLADRKWKPLLEKYKAMLDRPSRRDEAEAALLAVVDPRAVPMIGRVFAKGEATQPRAARLLGQVDSPSASKALAYLSVFAKSAEARRVAAETLRGRDAREYADLLIALMRDPIKYEVRPVGGPGSPGVLYVEGPRANVRRLYSPTSAFQPGDVVATNRDGVPVVDRTLSQDFASNARVPLNSGSRILGFATTTEDLYGSNFSGFGMGAGFLPGSQAGPPPITTADVVAAVRGHGTQGSHHAASAGHGRSSPFEFGSSSFSQVSGATFDASSSTMAEIPLAQVVAESRKSALASQRQLQADVEKIEGSNRAIRDLNDRAAAVLNGGTGQTLAADRTAWNKWWVDQLGYAFVTGQTATNPTFVEVVPSDYQPELTPSNIITQTSVLNRISCFGAGTPVHTLAGLRPIESLKVGDPVLTQSTASGALGYRPILVVHHNPPSATYRIKLRGESIVSSHFHRFWVAGRGWVMARDLKVGDPVRTLGGVSTVESVEPDKVQLVYNLDVAEDADFFAGSAGALVHDNTLPDPRLVPFDAAPASFGVAGAGPAR